MQTNRTVIGVCSQPDLLRPLVLVHARALLTSHPDGATDYIDADLHDPDRVLAEAARTLNFSQPVALILSGVLGHVPDTAEATSIVDRLLAALPSGSYLSLNDGTSVASGEQADEALEEYADTGAVAYHNRTPQEITSFFAGLELIDPASCPAPTGALGRTPIPPLGATSTAASVANPDLNLRLFNPSEIT